MRDQWEEIDRYLTTRGLRVGTPSLTQTTTGKHAASSLHYAGTARDYGMHDSDAVAIARALEFIAAQPNGPIEELFFAPLGIWYKNGQKMKSAPLRVGGHQDHCHVALKPFRRLL